MTCENGRIWRRRIFWFVNSAFTNYSREGCRTMSRIIMLRYWRWRPKECASLCVRQSCLWPPPIWPCCCQSGDGPRSQVEALPSAADSPPFNPARAWPGAGGMNTCLCWKWMVACHCCNPMQNRGPAVHTCSVVSHKEVFPSEWYRSDRVTQITSEILCASLLHFPACWLLYFYCEHIVRWAFNFLRDYLVIFPNGSPLLAWF